MNKSPQKWFENIRSQILDLKDRPDFRKGLEALIEEHSKDLPCPFCGAGEGRIHLRHDASSKTFSIRCSECGAYGPSTESPISAKKAWNKRNSQS